MFKNKVAVVTGAGGTLCSEIAINLAKEGAKVVLVGRTEEKLTKVYDEITSNGGAALVYPCDVTDKEAISALANEVKNKFGLCDYLINGAGGNNVKAMPTITKFDKREIPEGERGLYDTDLDAFESVLNIERKR